MIPTATASTKTTAKPSPAKLTPPAAELGVAMESAFTQLVKENKQMKKVNAAAVFFILTPLAC